jgi:hypothetical protein
VGLGLANKREFDFYKKHDFDVCDATTIAVVQNAVVPPIYHPHPSLHKEHGVGIAFCLLTPTDCGLLLAMYDQLLKWQSLTIKFRLLPTDSCFLLEMLHTNECSVCPSSCAKAKGFAVKTEYEDFVEEGLGCPNKRLFDVVKQSTFAYYTQYMVRKRKNRGEGKVGGGSQDGWKE